MCDRVGRCPVSDCVPGVEAGGGGELVRDVRDIVTVAQPAPLSSPLATSTTTLPRQPGGISR